MVFAYLCFYAKGYEWSFKEREGKISHKEGIRGIRKSLTWYPFLFFERRGFSREGFSLPSRERFCLPSRDTKTSALYPVSLSCYPFMKHVNGKQLNPLPVKKFSKDTKLGLIKIYFVKDKYKLFVLFQPF